VIAARDRLLSPELSVSPIPPAALVLARRTENDDLGGTIAALAARLHAATYELLVLLREFDERTGWNNGFLSCATGYIGAPAGAHACGLT
jgi:hypothetical protein